MNKSIELHIHDGHNSSLIVVDHKTKPFIWCKWKRFTRIKNQGGFPYLALKNSQEYLRFSASEVKKIYFSTKTVPYVITQKNSIFRRIFYKTWWFLPKVFTNQFVTNFYLKLSCQRKKDLVKILHKIGLGKAEICFFEHHLCHSASILSFYRIRQKRFITFTLDGWRCSFRLNNSFQKESIQNIKKIHTLDSLGEIYSQSTALLKMKPMEHEYKLMGLAHTAKKNMLRKLKI